MDIRIFVGLWEFSENPSEEPVFKCLTGTFEDGIYQQFEGKDASWDTSVDEFYNHLAQNEDIINITKFEMIRLLSKDGKAHWCGSGHGAYMAILR